MKVTLLTSLVVSLILAIHIGCASSGSQRNTVDSGLVVSGRVILPDSSAVPGAFVRTEPPSENLAADNEGWFSVTRLPGPNEYTFVAEHPDGAFDEGRTTARVEYGDTEGIIYIVIGKTQRMDLLDPGDRSLQNRRRGKKRTGTR